MSSHTQYLITTLTLYYKVSFVNRDTQVLHKPLNFLCTTARDFVATR